jgi:hypothetical protein
MSLSYRSRADNVIGALRRRKHKKVPLFMRIEAEYQKKATELEQEKVSVCLNCDPHVFAYSYVSVCTCR